MKITKSKGIRKSCRICKYYNGGAKSCKFFKITVSSLNNATHCKGYEVQFKKVKQDGRKS